MTEGDEKTVIIAVDGGISSQIAFVAFGMYLEELYGDQVRVAYDLSWYERFGCDGNAKFVRNWDMPNAFPDLKLKEAARGISEKWARWFGQYSLENAKQMFIPAYLNGYPKGREQCVYRYREKLRSFFRPALSKQSSELASKILRSGHACGVHVRRGDLSEGNPGYGQPTSINYYITAVSVIRGIDPKVELFFFSEEPDWIVEEIVPRLPNDCYAEVVRGNGSDKGYEDLYLLTQCDYIVSSIGSFGPTAALLSNRCKWLVMSRYRADILANLSHCIYVNDDREGRQNDYATASSGCERQALPVGSFLQGVLCRLHLFGLTVKRIFGALEEIDYRIGTKRLQFKFQRAGR